MSFCSQILVDKPFFSVLTNWLPPGENHIPLLDSAGRVVAVLASMSTNVDFMGACTRAYQKMDDASTVLGFSAKENAHRRGRYPVLNVGVTAGQGSEAPLNKGLDKSHSVAVDKLLQDEDIKRIASYQSCMLPLNFPSLYRASFLFSPVEALVPKVI